MNVPTDPGSLAVLERRITGFASDTGQSVSRVRITIAQVVVAQMLSPAVVKGGSGMKFRLGMGFARDSKDLDVAWRANQDFFVHNLNKALASRWGPFGGRVLTKPQRLRDGILDSYLMQPYAIKLTAYHKSFCTVIVEVGYDELGATSDGSLQFLLANDISEMFIVLGLPVPRPVPIMAIHHQIAQKIHACTESNSERAHDLVDLQLLWQADDTFLDLVAHTTQRLFAFRKAHSFPTICQAGDDWNDRYREASKGLDVIDGVQDAVRWLNGQIKLLEDRIGLDFNGESGVSDGT